MCEYCDYEAEFARAYATVDGFSTVPNSSTSGLDLNFDRDIVHDALTHGGHPIDAGSNHPLKGGGANPVGGPTLGGILPTGHGASDPLGAVIGQKMANQIYNTPHNVEHGIVKAISDTQKNITNTVLGGANNIQHYIPIILAGGLAIVAMYLISKR